MSRVLARSRTRRPEDRPPAGRRVNVYLDAAGARRLDRLRALYGPEWSLSALLAHAIEEAYLASFPADMTIEEVLDHD